MFVFEREVDVPTARTRQIRYLTFYTDRGKGALENGLDVSGQFADRNGLWGRRTQGKGFRWGCQGELPERPIASRVT